MSMPIELNEHHRAALRAAADGPIKYHDYPGTTVWQLEVAGLARRIETDSEYAIAEITDTGREEVRA